MSDVLNETKESIKDVLEFGSRRLTDALDECKNICKIHNEQAMYHENVPQIANVFVSQDLSFVDVTCIIQPEITFKIKVNARKQEDERDHRNPPKENRPSYR